MITEKDKELIAQAEHLDYTKWEIAYKLADKAETKKAHDILCGIASRLYHIEEFHAGLI